MWQPHVEAEEKSMYPMNVNVSALRYFIKVSKCMTVHSEYEISLSLSQAWAHWTVLVAGGSKGGACLFVQCTMGAGSRSAPSHLRSKKSESSLTLAGARWASTTLWPRSTWPRCLPASTLPECSRLWAWARADWGCAAASPLLLMCSSVRTRSTGGLVGPAKAGGVGRFPSCPWGKWYRSLRSWLRQTQTQAWCPVLDRRAPPWLPCQMWGFLGCFPLGRQDRKLRLNKKSFNGSIRKTPTAPFSGLISGCHLKG